MLLSASTRGFIIILDFKIVVVYTRLKNLVGTDKVFLIVGV
jgi:hypothetical protein